MPLGETLDRPSQSRYDEGRPRTGAQNIATFEKPGILAVLGDGRPCRIIATGDYPGHSDAVQVVNEDRTLTWESARQVRVVDSDFLPPSREALAQMLREFNR